MNLALWDFTIEVFLRILQFPNGGRGAELLAKDVSTPIGVQ
jgi:hypothetical protein